MIEILDWSITILSVIIAALWILGSLPQLDDFWRKRSWKLKDRLNLFLFRTSALTCMLCLLRLGLAPTETLSFIFLAIAIVFFLLDSYATAILID